MAPPSSANKVAKLAQKGKGKKVRFQGGALFPLILTVVVLLFGGLIVYARQTRPGPGEGAPTSNDHWHAAIGFYTCDDKGLQVLPNLTGALEETDPATGNLSNTNFVRTGIHSHADGVMHWHPSSSGKATGTNAKLKVFLDNYGVSLSNTKLTFPASQGGKTFEEGKTVCKIDGVEKKASLKLWVWDNYATVKTADPSVYTANMGDVRIKTDGMVFMIAFVPDDVKPKPPDAAFNLKELGAADGSGGAAATTTVVGGTGASTIPGTVTTLPGKTATTGPGTATTGPGTATTVSAKTSTSVVGEPSATSTTVAAKSATTTTGG